jgi:hypothetical protein
MPHVYDYELELEVNEIHACVIGYDMNADGEVESWKIKEVDGEAIAFDGFMMTDIDADEESRIIDWIYSDWETKQ